MSNLEIRYEIQRAGFRNWQVAEAMGITECHFSRLLRHELTDERKQKVREAIEILRGEQTSAIR